MITATQHKEVMSIASVTKLFTAALILDEQLDLFEKVKVQGKTTGRFPIGSKVPRIELMKAMLIASDNRAADTLAHSYPGGYEKFIKDVNNMIGFRGLKDTQIVDASGISASNVSTAEDLVNFVYSLRHYPLIISLSSSTNDIIRITTKKKDINLPIRNTNPDLVRYNNILISKTGFTSKAGRCLVMLITYQDEIYGLAILGEKTPKTRSKVVQDLMSSL
jgi:D-alanyl-D-alanine endopeptidase (penicillin-binding protein 7)